MYTLIVDSLFFLTKFGGINYFNFGMTFYPKKDEKKKFFMLMRVAQQLRCIIKTDHFEPHPGTKNPFFLSPKYILTKNRTILRIGYITYNLYVIINVKCLCGCEIYHEYPSVIFKQTKNSQKIRLAGPNWTIRAAAG